MKPSHNHAFEHLFHATLWSIAGFKAAWKHEQAFRIEMFMSLLVIPAAFYLGESHIEKVLLCGSWLLVIVVELLNSAVEAVVDRVGTDYHELSGRAKDLGSAAVFMGNIIFAGTWIIIIFKP